MRAPSRTHTKTGTKDPRVTPWIHHSPQAVFKGPCSGQLRGAGEGGGISPPDSPALQGQLLLA